MADKILISTTAERATLSQWRDSKLGPCHAFDNDEAGWFAFEGFLKSVKGIPVYVMVDAVEEDYRFEALPHTKGRDRHQLVGRKLRQLYRNTPYCTAWMQGRDSGKRRDDVYLFAALTNPDMLFGWVQALARQQCPVVGIYTLPMVSVALAERLRLKAQNLLLVSQHASGLRQTVIRDGKLRLSRLTRLEAANGESRTSAYAEEIQNTRLYLHALKVMTLDDHMTVVLLDQDDSLMELSHLVQNRFVNTRVAYLSRADILARVGISPEVLAYGPDTVYLQILGNKAPSCNLAPTSLRTHYNHYQTRRAIYAASAAAALAATLWIGSNLWQQSEIDLETRRLQTATNVEDQKYEAVTRQFPKAPTSASNLRKAVEIAEKIRVGARNPEDMLITVSHALKDSSGIFLRSLTWKSGAPEPAETPAGGLRHQASELRQRAIVEAEIRPFKGDFRAAIAAIDRFAAELSKEKDVAEVRILQLPINVSETSVLSGNTAKETQVQAVTAQFTLEILLKPGV